MLYSAVWSTGGHDCTVTINTSDKLMIPSCFYKTTANSCHSETDRLILSETEKKDFSHTCLYGWIKLQKSRGITWLWSCRQTLWWLNKTSVVHFDVYFLSESVSKATSSMLTQNSVFPCDEPDANTNPLIGSCLSIFYWRVLFVFCRSNVMQNSYKM